MTGSTASANPLPGVGLLPGIGLLVAIGLLARGMAAVVPIPALLGAVLVGILLANTVGVPAAFRPGVDTYKLWLEVGIVLMGVRVSLSALVAAGPTLLLTVLGVVCFTLVVAESLARGMGLQRRLGSLVAAGASVCGVSAVVAVAGAIRADEEHVAYATSTVLVFDAITLFAYPAIGRLLGLPDRVFGIWAGLTMFSTGPVTAAGFAYSPVAGEWATVAKLTRNVLLGGLVVAYSVLYADSGERESAGPRNSLAVVRSLWDGFPKFVLGFLSLVVLASLGVFSAAETALIEAAYRGAFLVAFAGLGTSVAVRELRDTGVRPLAVLALTLAVVSVVVLGVVTFVF